MEINETGWSHPRDDRAGARDEAGKGTATVIDTNARQGN